MSEQDKTVQDSATIESQDTELEINLDDTSDVDAIKAEAEKATQFAKQALARAKKAEAELKTYKTTPPEQSKRTVVDIDEAVDLRLDGYTKEEVSIIMQNGGRKALENPVIKAGIEAVRTQRKAENAIPTQDTAKSEVERKHTKEQLQNMSAEELYKILPKA